jgi:protein SCO1/2
MKNIILKFLVFVLIMQTFSCKSKKEPCCSKDTCEKPKDEAFIQPESSIYNLESSWLNQKNERLFLKDLNGKIVISAMVFTHCESACPRIVSDLQRIEKSFTSEELSQVQFVLISMDPARDTPERFLSFIKEYQINNNWICVSSSEEATMEIANVLNVRFKKLSDGGFDHSNIIHVLDQEGNLVFQQNGLEQDSKELTNKVKSLIK